MPFPDLEILAGAVVVPNQDTCVSGRESSCAEIEFTNPDSLYCIAHVVTCFGCQWVSCMSISTLSNDKWNTLKHQLELATTNPNTVLYCNGWTKTPSIVENFHVKSYYLATL